MKLNCYIVDEEVGLNKLLWNYIDNTEGLELKQISNNPNKVLSDMASQNRPSLAFLNIDMPGMFGLKYVSQFNLFSAVIVISSFKELAVEAFEESVCDYLLRPFNYNRFLKCICKVRQEIAKTNPPLDKANFYVKGGMKGKMIKINIEEIIYIEAAQNYVQIYFLNERIMTYSSLGEIMKQLPKNVFSRIHKSYIININSVKKLEKGQIVLKNKIGLPLGRSYKDSFLRHVQVSLLINK
jgi:DNA-binding LytR/AlgR family response regulator